ncbi:MAG: cyclic nucleotide-binding domain-containing protein [Syntrophales bacterium]|nr:cyclic nucleotide-binding domain-containing protein [Syntrophales bacterium]
MAAGVARFFLSFLVVAVVFGNIAGNSFAADNAKTLELSQALSQAELFAELTDEERSALKPAATLRHCKKGDRIIEQGKSLGSMFIVLEAPAEVRVNGEPVATLPEQSLLGEIEFLDELPASADVVVLKETRVIELNNVALAGLMEKRPRLGYVLMREIAGIAAQRLRAMNPQ